MLSKKEKKENRNKLREKWVKENPEKMYKMSRVCNWKKRGIKITYEEYEKILKEQRSCCKICGVNEEELKFNLCVDHNHENGEIRGLLCNLCNKLLGNAKDDIDILESAIDYLQKVTKIVSI